MEVLFPFCAGLDVHKQIIGACVLVSSPAGLPRQLRKFGTTMADLAALAAWLTGLGLTHVAMESTGVYWKPRAGGGRAEEAGEPGLSLSRSFSYRAPVLPQGAGACRVQRTACNAFGRSGQSSWYRLRYSQSVRLLELLPTAFHDLTPTCKRSAELPGRAIRRRLGASLNDLCAYW